MSDCFSVLVDVLKTVLPVVEGYVSDGSRRSAGYSRWYPRRGMRAENQAHVGGHRGDSRSWARRVRRQQAGTAGAAGIYSLMVFQDRRSSISQRARPPADTHD